MMKNELSLEQWTASMEAMAEIDEAVTDIGLVAEPTEGLSPATIDVIQTAVDHVGRVNGLENSAVVISAESFSFEGMKTFMSNAITRLKEFIKAIVQKVLGWLSAFDQGVRNVLMTAKRWDDKMWEHIDEFMGNDRHQGTAPAEHPLAFVIGTGVGDKQITSLDDLLKSYQDFHKSLGFQTKLLDRDSELINDLLVAVGHLGLLELDKGVAVLKKAVASHHSAISDGEFSANKDILGGLELVRVGRPDNLGITDLEINDLIKSISTVKVTQHVFEPKPLSNISGKTLRTLASEVEKVNKTLSKYKDNFTKYAKDVESETDKLDKALKALEKAAPDSPDAAALQLGQRLTATVMWLSSNYFATGVKLLGNAGDIDKQFMRYLDKVSKALNTMVPKDKTQLKPKAA